MNNKGAGLLIAFLVAGMLFAAGILMVNFLKPEVSLAISSNQLDCNNLTISDGVKLTCLALDAVVPYSIVLVISIAGGIVASRILI